MCSLVPFDLYDYQEEMVETFHNNRFVICKMPRQTGKSTTIIAFLLHYLLFNESVHIAILANKAATARELLSRLQLAYEHLPKYLQQKPLPKQPLQASVRDMQKL